MKAIDNLLDDLGHEKFDLELKAHDSVSGVLRFCRENDTVKKLIMLSSNSETSGDIVITRINELLDPNSFEDWDATLVALLVVLIDSNHPQAGFVSMSFLRYPHELRWTKPLAQSFLLKAELRK